MSIPQRVRCLIRGILGARGQVETECVRCRGHKFGQRDGSLRVDPVSRQIKAQANWRPLASFLLC